MENSKKKWIFILLITLCSFTLVSASWYNPFTWFQSQSNEIQTLNQLGNLQIKQLPAEWQITRATGNEANFTLWTANAKDKKTEIGFILKHGINPASVDLTDKQLFNKDGIAIKDNKNKNITLKYESAKCGGLDCYYISLTNAQTININNEIKLGTNSIIAEYLNTTSVLYNFSQGSGTLSLKNLDLPLYLNNFTILDNGDNLKVQAIDNAVSQGTLSNYEWIYNSTLPLYQKGFKWFISGTEESYGDLYGITNAKNLDFTQDCIRSFEPYEINDSEFGIITLYNKSSNCRFNYYQDGENYILKVTYLSDENIDPSIELSIEQTFTTAVLNNVTTEAGNSNFSHLSTDSSIVGYWDFDVQKNGTASDTAYDLSGNNLDGTLIGTATMGSGYGLFGNGTYLDGNSDYVKVNDDDSLTPMPISVSLWVNSASNGQSASIYTQRANANNRIDIYWGDSISRLYCTFSTGAGYNPGYASISLPASEWDLVTCTWDGTTVRTYFNGVSVANETYGGTLPNIASYLSIGARVSESANYFAGYIDDVMVLNKELSQQEVLDLYNNQYSRFYPTGTQDIINLNLSDGSDTENRANVTLNNCLTLNQTNLSGQIGINNGSGYEYNGTEINFTGCVVNNLSIEGSPSNVSLRLGFTNNQFNSYTPHIIGNITTDSWTEGGAEDTTPPQITSPANATITYGNNLNVDFDADESVTWGTNYTDRFTINSTGGLTNSTPIAVGTYLINVSANDTSTNGNYSMYQVTINQATSTNTLTVGSNITYGATSNFSCSNDLLTSILYVNDVDKTIDENNLDLVRSAGNYNVTCIATGNSNVTGDYDELPFGIAKATPSASLTGTGTQTYPYASNVSFSESNTGDSDVNYTLFRDGVLTNFYEEGNFAVGTYNYTLNTTGTFENYTTQAVLDTQNLEITQNPEQVYTLFNDTSPITYPTSFRVFSNATPQFTIYQNGSVVGNNTQLNLSAGTYNFTTIRTDNINYSDVYDEQTFQIDKATISADLVFNDTSPNTYGDTLLVTCYGDIFLRDDVDISAENNTAIVLGAGSYDYSCIIEESQNYSYSEDNETFVINQYQTALGITGTPAPIIYNATNDFVGTGCPDETCSFNMSVAQVYGQGSWTFNYSFLGNANYSFNWTVRDLTVLQNDSICGLFVNTTNPLSVGGVFYIGTNCSSDYMIYQNETGYANNTALNLSVGLYNFTVIRNDTGNYSNITTSLFMNISSVADTTPPVVTIVSPTNMTNSTDYDLYVNFTTSDNVAVSECWWNDGGANISNPSCLNLTGAWVYGLNHIRVWVNDTSGNNATDEVYFQIDNKAPQFTEFPTQQDLFENQSLNYQINATDLIAFLFYINDTTNFVMDANTGIITNITSLSAGDYTILVTANDSLSNTNTTIFNVNVSVYIIPDTTNPQFTTFPVDNSTTYGLNVRQQIDATDNVAIASYGVNDTNFTINTTGYISNITSLSALNLSVNITVTDTSGNINYTIWNVTVYKSISNCSISGNNPTYPNPAIVSGSCDNPEGSENLYMDGVGVSNPFNQVLGVATYNFTLNDSATTNYTFAQDYLDVVVSQNTTYTLTLTIKPLTNVSNGTTTYANGTGCPAQLNCTLYQNATYVLNPEVAQLAIGIYNYTYNTTGNANYSTTFVSKILQVYLYYASNVTGTIANFCRYKKFAYYDTKLWWFKEVNCI